MSLSPQWCLQETPVWVRGHLVSSLVTWEMRRGGWWSLGVEDYLSSLSSSVRLAAVLLTAWQAAHWVATESRATTHLFKSTRKEVTHNMTETGMKALCLYMVMHAASNTCQDIFTQIQKCQPGGARRQFRQSSWCILSLSHTNPCLSLEQSGWPGIAIPKWWTNWLALPSLHPCC